MTDVGLCFNCRWMRSTANRRGSVFFRCARAEDDARYVRYPPLPVLSCPGYEEAMLFVVLMHYSQPLEAADPLRAAPLRHVEGSTRRGVFRALPLARTRRDSHNATRISVLWMMMNRQCGTAAMNVPNGSAASESSTAWSSASVSAIMKTSWDR